MVKHTQAIRRQKPDKLFECVWPFYGVGAKGSLKYLPNWHLLFKVNKEFFI